MNRIFVLGSNSFAGANFINCALSEGFAVWGINRSPEGDTIFLPYRGNSRSNYYRFEMLDINKEHERLFLLMDKVQPDFVVDFAGQGMVAESWIHPAQWYATNIVAKARLHDFLRQTKWLRLYVRVSTPEVYGHTPSPVSEDRCYDPSSPYAVSHAATDMSLNVFHRYYDMPMVITRFANFYGPGQQLYRIVPRTIIYALSGRKLQLHGGGVSLRAFIHIRDVAEALLGVLGNGSPGETYHFSPDHLYSIRKIVDIICEELGYPFENLVEISEERPTKDAAYFMDSTKARVSLGWSPRIEFVQGIRDTIDWVRSNYETIRKLSWNYVYKP